MPQPAARIGDNHTCPYVDPATGVPHTGGPILSGYAKVIIGGQPAARVGDPAQCVGATDTISTGSPGVIIGGQPAARVGDVTAHGGAVAQGYGKVIIE